MAKRNLLIILAVVVVGVVAGWFFWRSAPSETPAEAPQAAALPPKEPTREAAPANLAVPEVGSSNNIVSSNNTVSGSVPEQIAVPESASKVGATGKNQRLIFEIKAENDQFSPSTVIVHANDVVRLKFTAVDKNYSFTQPDYGLNEPLLAGKVKTIEFQVAASGKFKFYCESCGGPSKGPVGYIIAAQK